MAALYWGMAVGGPLMAAALAGAAPGRPAPPPAAFARCTGCHVAGKGDAAEIAPNLFGVIGTKAGGRPGYDYSPALKRSGIVWTRATLTRFIADPQQVVPGTLMRKLGGTPAEQAQVAAYLVTLR